MQDQGSAYGVEQLPPPRSTSSSEPVLPEVAAGLSSRDAMNWNTPAWDCPRGRQTPEGEIAAPVLWMRKPVRGWNVTEMSA